MQVFGATEMDSAHANDTYSVVFREGLTCVILLLTDKLIFCMLYQYYSIFPGTDTNIKFTV